MPPRTTTLTPIDRPGRNNWMLLLFEWLFLDSLTLTRKYQQGMSNLKLKLRK
jgi:hypothetical protein